MSFGLYVFICFLIWALVFGQAGFSGCLFAPIYILICLAIYMGHFMPTSHAAPVKSPEHHHVHRHQHHPIHAGASH